MPSPLNTEIDKEIDDLLLAYSMYWSGGIIQPLDETVIEMGTAQAKTALTNLIIRERIDALELIWNKLPEAVMQPPNAYYDAAYIDGLIRGKIAELNKQIVK